MIGCCYGNDNARPFAFCVEDKVIHQKQYFCCLLKNTNVDYVGVWNACFDFCFVSDDVAEIEKMMNVSGNDTRKIEESMKFYVVAVFELG